MLVTTDVAHDSRVLREAEALAGQGHEIHVVGKDVPPDWQPPAGVVVESATGGGGLKPNGGAPSLPRFAERTLRWSLLPRHRRHVWRTWCDAARATVGSRVFDVVHAHDFNVLELAEELATRMNARLVYDSHEWWSGRQRHGRPTPLERRRDRGVERRITARADAVLTVSEGIARRLERWHGSRVTVVRNTFPPLTTDTPLPERPDGLVYAGRVGGGRDLGTVLLAAGAAGLEAYLVGPIDRQYLPKLRGTTGNIWMKPTMPLNDVDALLRRVGISVITLTDTCENHRLALPNKLFHAIRAGVPVIAADLPEMRAVVTAHGLGELYRPGDPGSMRDALSRLIADYPRYAAAVAAARDEFTWETDARALIAAYEALDASRTTRRDAKAARPSIAAAGADA
jgi:glycosyltransferase involved in cell wall biosynthesis